MSLTDQELERIRAEREAQGFPPQITDPEALARVATTLRHRAGVAQPDRAA